MFAGDFHDRPSNMKTGSQLIAEERERQISQEGWTAKHDDEHDDQALALAAAVYALPPEWRLVPSGTTTMMQRLWPFDDYWLKEGDRVRELTKAGALIAAEIDRVQRKSANE